MMSEAMFSQPAGCPADIRKWAVRQAVLMLSGEGPLALDLVRQTAEILAAFAAAPTDAQVAMRQWAVEQIVTLRCRDRLSDLTLRALDLVTFVEQGPGSGRSRPACADPGALDWPDPGAAMRLDTLRRMPVIEAGRTQPSLSLLWPRDPDYATRQTMALPIAAKLRLVCFFLRNVWACRVLPGLPDPRGART